MDYNRDAIERVRAVQEKMRRLVNELAEVFEGDSSTTTYLVDPLRHMVCGGGNPYNQDLDKALAMMEKNLAPTDDEWEEAVREASARLVAAPAGLADPDDVAQELADGRVDRQDPDGAVLGWVVAAVAEAAEELAEIARDEAAGVEKMLDNAAFEAAIHGGDKS